MVGTIVLYIFLSLCLLMIIIVGGIHLMKKRKYISNTNDTTKDELVVTQPDGTIVPVSNEPDNDNGGDVELELQHN